MVFLLIVEGLFQMKKTKFKVSSYLLIPIFLAALLLIFSRDAYAATANINPYNAVQVEVNSTNEDGTVKIGQDLWYTFTAPQGNSWVIARLTGTQETGTMQIAIFDEQLNMVKENYTQAGNHIAEIVCRMNYEGIGSTEEFIPRLVADKKYYIKISGTGSFNLNLDQFMDDYAGDYDSATVLNVGTTISGTLEREEDIDSFCFEVPNNNSYKVTVTATRKMDVKIADDNEYVLNSNALRVIRDNGSAEYTISGSGVKRYFFLSGKGNTHYRISVEIDEDAAELGLWTRVTANVGENTIRVDTKKGARISIIVKKGSKKKSLKIKYKGKKKKKITVTQKSASKTYKLTRKLKPGDVVIVTATKKRYKEFNYKKKMK